MNVSCPNCWATVGEQIGGKLAVGLAAALLGSRMNPAAAVVFGLFGALVGHRYTDTANRTCPQCGLVLRIAGEFLA